MNEASMRPALVLVDLQEDFFADPRLARHRASIIDAVNELARVAREGDHPVVWVRQEFEPDLGNAFLSMRDTGTRITIRGTAGCALAAGLQREPADLEVVKHRYSAFFGTRLVELLRSLDVTHVILGGINSHACIRATAIDAFQHDFRVILACDALASYDDEYHRESMRYLVQSIGPAMGHAGVVEVLRSA